MAAGWQLRLERVPCAPLALKALLPHLSQHGAQGSCECFAAFGGSDCAACAEGYIQSGGTCSRYVRIRLPYIALQDRAASVNVRETLSL